MLQQKLDIISYYIAIIWFNSKKYWVDLFHTKLIFISGLRFTKFHTFSFFMLALLSRTSFFYRHLWYFSHPHTRYKLQSFRCWTSVGSCSVRRNRWHLSLSFSNIINKKDSLTFTIVLRNNAANPPPLSVTDHDVIANHLAPPKCVT